MIAARPGPSFVEFPGVALETAITAEPLVCRGGLVTVPDRPGLGADPDPAVLTRYPYDRAAARPFYLT